jgi:hypothetical protein
MDERHAKSSSGPNKTERKAARWVLPYGLEHVSSSKCVSSGLTPATHVISRVAAALFDGPPSSHVPMGSLTCLRRGRVPRRGATRTRGAAQHRPGGRTAGHHLPAAVDDQWVTLTAASDIVASQDARVRAWEYLIVALPPFDVPSEQQGASPAVAALNHEGRQGWEAVGMTALTDGSVAVLLKRPTESS